MHKLKSFSKYLKRTRSEKYHQQHSLFIPSSCFLCVRVRACVSAILSTFFVYSPRICVKSMTIDWGCESVGIHKFCSSVILSHSESRSSSAAHCIRYIAIAGTSANKKQQAIFTFYLIVWIWFGCHSSDFMHMVISFVYSAFSFTHSLSLARSLSLRAFIIQSDMSLAGNKDSWLKSQYVYRKAAYFIYIYIYIWAEKRKACFSFVTFERCHLMCVLVSAFIKIKFLNTVSRSKIHRSNQFKGKNSVANFREYT